MVHLFHPFRYVTGHSQTICPSVPQYLCSRPTCKTTLIAEQKLSEDPESTLIYDIMQIKQVYLNVKNAAFLYRDLEISWYMSVCKLNTFQ